MHKLSYFNENSKLLLSLIQKKGPIAKSELLLIGNMTLSTLQRAIKPLIDEGLIIESAIGESTGGRKPTLYDINPKDFYVIGVDISRTYLRVVITNLNISNIFLEKVLPISSPQESVRVICNTITEKLNQLSIPKSMVLGIGIGTVGPLDREKGLILNPRNFPSNEWVNFPLKMEIEKNLNLPAFIDNGANCAVLAEQLFGAGSSFKSVSYFNLGIGVRTGIISSGSLIRTTTDSEDSFGHMVIDMDGDKCSCGNYGCVECYCSINAIKNKFISKVKIGRNTSSSKPLDEITYMDICKMAENGDELAKEVITNSASVFGLALANYINLLNPELVILSGPLIKYSPLFYSVATATASKRFYLKDRSKIIFNKGGNFQDNSIALGSAAMVFEDLLSK
ncbi:ROK family transcriptional regulator [Clostridium swellfunianum]|uniref:ROK family transcriptional regulator n=1 Tax=Clostridium swellfunianum TaxID=1367462 RepID=UPI002030E0E8|nr:ROK family transcriptional regulator [Clostridium swellfunianum]MCM0649963.1 ROK family transcriptional regulator [Clostridium swellfunianum]